MQMNSELLTTGERNGGMYFRKDIAGRQFGDRNGIATASSHEVTSAVGSLFRNI